MLSQRGVHGVSTTIAVGLDDMCTELGQFAVVCLSVPTYYSGEGSYVSVVTKGFST